MPEPRTQHERQVVGALLLPQDAPLTEKTAAAVARRTGLSESDVRRTLQELSKLEPPLVHSEVDAKLGVQFWLIINLDAHDGFDDG